MTSSTTAASIDATAAWSRRVRRVGGFIQLAFAAFWLVRGAQSIGSGAGVAIASAGLLTVAAVLVYALRVTAGSGRRVARRSASSDQ